MNESKTGTDNLIEKIIDALNTDNAPEWNAAPSWADHVLTWEGLRRLANDLLGRKPYDGRDPLAEPVLRDFLSAALRAGGYLVLTPAQTDRIRRGVTHYGPLCPRHAPQYSATRLGTVPDPSFVGAVCVKCGRTADISQAGQKVNIYVW
jgi:hypothetical protein